MLTVGLGICPTMKRSTISRRRVQVCSPRICLAFAKNVPIGALRRLVSILLLAAFGLPFAQSLFALTPKSEANLPACCRRNGKHHCMMSMTERRKMSSDEPQFAPPVEKCPYCPGALTLGHQTNPFSIATGQIVIVGSVGQSSVVAQTESKRRISRDRSRQKRGPPAPVFSLLS